MNTRAAEDFGVAGANSAYVSNANLAQIAARLRDAKRVVILTHSKPDGDAIGSSLALARTLTRLGIVATPVFLAPWSPRMDSIVGETPIIKEIHGVWSRKELADVDCVAIVDTGSWTQIADARHWLEPHREHALIIDHHAHGDADVAELRHVDTSAAAATQLVAEVCRQLLAVERCADLPIDIAEPLYLGLATDTGWFRHSNVTSDVMRLASELIDAGVDQNRLFRRVEQSDSPKRLLLLQRALASLSLFANDRAAIISVTAADIAACEAGQDELGGLTDLPQTVGTVRVVAVLTELEPSLVKVSLRSKAVEPPEQSVDVNMIAQEFGGGGHVHAAGAKLKLSLVEARRRVTQVLTSALP